MLILAIETSTASGSVALLRGEQVWSRPLPGAGRTAQDLAPALRDLLAEAELRPNQVDVIGVTSGPGSFTGLRVGVTTAKTLAYALDRPCVGVNTLDVIASQAACAELPDGTQLWAIMDAQRRQFFAASYRSQGGVFLPQLATHVIDQSDWLADLEPGAMVAGPGVTTIRSRLPEGLGLQIVDPTKWPPNAVAVAQLAQQQLTTGRQSDGWQLMPQYYRLSAAEEKARGASPAV